MRILHFSDIHIQAPLRTVPWREWLGKRLFGGLNLISGRGRGFREAVDKMPALDEFRVRESVELVLCTGDFTALGTRRELEMARRAVEPLMEAPRGFLTVPGNHDVYSADVIRDGRFLDSFGDTHASDLPEYSLAPLGWPQVRLLDEHVAVVGVDSTRPNLMPWLSSGVIPEPQMDRLRQILADPRVERRFVFVITHYAPCLEDGRPDRRHHGMENATEFLAVCGNIPRGAILCGHVHHRFMARPRGVQPPVFCAGSTTKRRSEGLWMFDISAERAVATPGHWDGGAYRLEPDRAIDW